MSKQLWIDCDGVLADFDSYFNETFGHPKNLDHNNRAPFDAKVWEDLEKCPSFYFNLPVMPGAKEFMKFLEPYRPIILTGMPEGDWAYTQKREWQRRWFPGVPMVMCLSKNKSEYAQRGDVLVDDWLKYRPEWQRKGGVFVHHTSWVTTMLEMQKLGYVGQRESTNDDD